MSILKWDHAGLFVGGMLFATKGIELLASKTAHKAYVQATAFGLRCRDEVMGGVKDTYQISVRALYFCGEK